jgi:hypothetical protein
MAYELESRKGPVNRCIPCLAIEQGQQKFSLPYESWLSRDELEDMDGETFDPRKHDYKTAQAWFRILARIREDEPILLRNEDKISAVFEDTRTFLINIMGEDAYKSPSELKA